MNVLETPTLTISVDEKCLWLEETDQVVVGSGQHRFQKIVVMRGDSPAIYSWDMGPRDMYRRDALMIPLGVVLGMDGETYPSDGRMPRELVKRYEPLIKVGHAMDLADELRADSLREDMMLLDKDWEQDYIAHSEEVAKWRTYRSHFGPGLTIVRN